MKNKPGKLVLITGVGGFVGCNLVEKQEKFLNKFKVVGVTTINEDPHRLGVVKKIFARHKHWRLITADLRVIGSLTVLPAGVDVVINLAAEAKTWADDFSCNDVGVDNLSNYLDLDRGDKWIQISSVAVWAGRNDVELPLTAKTEVCPNNEYGLSKWRGERMVEMRAKVKGFGYKILRLATVYGERCNADSLLPVVVGMAKGEKILSRLNWPGKTNLVSVDHVVEKIVGAIEKFDKFPALSIVGGVDVKVAVVMEKVYRGLERTYRPIRVPHVWWRSLARTRILLQYFEHLVPKQIYGKLWRMYIMCESVFWTGQEGELEKFEETVRWLAKFH